MTEQWQELKETIIELRDSNGTSTQQEICKFLANYMETLEKQMQQPCEDCISRQAVIDYAKDTCLDLDKDEDTEVFCDEIKALPSVTPERPKGKWKRIVGFEDCNYDKCSVCGVYQLFYYGKPSTNYCPNCGAEMSGGEECNSMAVKSED